MSTILRLPEKHKTESGEVKVIRQMSDREVSECLTSMKKRGYVGYQTWRSREPLAGCSEREWNTWVDQRVSVAIDALQEEIEYRRRNHLIFVDFPKKEEVME